jgi:hypothetical protein
MPKLSETYFLYLSKDNSTLFGRMKCDSGRKGLDDEVKDLRIEDHGSYCKVPGNHLIT